MQPQSFDNFHHDAPISHAPDFNFLQFLLNVMVTDISIRSRDESA